MQETQESLIIDPLDDPELKAERVQEELRAVASALGLPMGAQAAARLKAERVQERLKAMPGWTLREGSYALDRVRDLPSPFGAADYGTLILREAARTRQKVRVGLSGHRVMVTVLALRERDGIGFEQLEFAAGLL
jgi:hypothetical protein